MFTQGPSLVIDVDTGEIHRLHPDGTTSLLGTGGGGNDLSAYEIAVNNGFITVRQGSLGLLRSY